MRCKCMKINRVSGKANRAKNAGMAKWYNWTIGGVKRDGTDATQRTFLPAFRGCPGYPLFRTTPSPSGFTRAPPMKLMVKALECVRSGIGMPAFVGDESYINFFAKQSPSNCLPIEDARDWCWHRLRGRQCPGPDPYPGCLLLHHPAGYGYCPA